MLVMARTGRMATSEEQDTYILRGSGVICIDDIRDGLT